MAAGITEQVNDPRFGKPDSDRYWWHHAFIFTCLSNIQPSVHMSVVTTPDGKMTVCPVSGDENGPNLEQAIGVAKKLAAEGANKIDLCSGFNPELCKAIQEALGDKSKIAVAIQSRDL